jgi:hypothetical protein
MFSSVFNATVLEALYVTSSSRIVILIGEINVVHASFVQGEKTSSVVWCFLPSPLLLDAVICSLFS